MKYKALKLVDKQFTFGCELTAISPDFSNKLFNEISYKHTTDIYQHKIPAIKYRMAELSGIDDANTSVDIDQHCIEHTTPIFYSLDDLTTYYKHWCRTIKEFGLQPQHPKTVCGGNHIHIGFPRDYSMFFARNIFCMFLKYPVLALIFVDKDDTDSCNPFAQRRVNKIIKFCQRDMSSNDLCCAHLYRNKGDCITFNNSFETLEIRCLRAPVNLKEWKMQMQFIEYLYDNYLYDDSICIYVDAPIYTAIPKTLETAMEQFNDFFRTRIYRNAKEDWAKFCIARLKQRFS